MADGFLGIDLVAAFTLFGPAPVFMLLLFLFPCVPVPARGVPVSSAETKAASTWRIPPDHARRLQRSALSCYVIWTGDREMCARKKFKKARVAQ